MTVGISALCDIMQSQEQGKNCLIELINFHQPLVSELLPQKKLLFTLTTSLSHAVCLSLGVVIGCLDINKWI